MSETTVKVEVGQVWKDLDRRAKNRTITVAKMIDGGERVEAVITDGEGNSGKTIRLQVSRLNPKGHWRLLKNTDGSVPESGLDDDFENINEREASQMNQLVLFGTQEFVVDSVGLSKHGTMTIAGAEKTRDVLLKVHSAHQLWLGDLENAVNAAFGEEAAQVIDYEAYAKYGVSESTRKNWAWVASRVCDANRRIAQSWSHMQAVAALSTAVQRKFLEESRAEDWSVSTLKKEIASKTENSKSKLHFLLVVDCGTQARQKKMAEELEAEGLTVTLKEVTKREAKAKKAKKPKKEVTAKSKGKGKMSANRRKPG